MNKLKYTLVLLAAVLPFFCAAQMSGTGTNDQLEQLQKFNHFYRFLTSYYVDTVDNSKLVETAIREILLQLDPHSSYITAEEMVGVNETFDGSFSGIGIEFNVLRDTIIVVNVLAGGPSEAAGLLPNDRIVAVNDQNVVGTKQIDVPKILRGPKGTRADLQIVRAGETQPVHFTVIRDNIPIHTVDAAYKIDDHTGYIRINRFARTTFTEFLEACRKFGPVDALILDLRNNGGGLMDQAIELSNFFLPRGSLIVSMEGSQVPSGHAAARHDGLFQKGKVIVLVNELSASASEIVSGALQDWDRGLIIGRRTFGKGLVQRQFELNDGSAARITIARYHTPSGRVIQRPYEKGKGDEYQMDLYRRLSADSTASGVDSTQVYKTLRSGRTVYGGGGITPDITVETDTTMYSDYWVGLIRRGILVEYVISYMDRHRADLERQYPTIEGFLKDFQIDEKILAELREAADKKEIKYAEEDLICAKRLIENQLKALIAQKLWGMNEYYRVSNRMDETLDKAIEVLGKWNEYTEGIRNFQ